MQRSQKEKGNFKLSKDTGDFGGSSFGFDKLKWISNEISLDNENITEDQIYNRIMGILLRNDKDKYVE